MTPDNEPEEHIDELLEDDDDLLTPDEDQAAEKEEAPEPDPEPEASEEKPEPEAPKTEPEPAITPSRSGSLLLALIIVVLLASVVGLGLYCGSLKGQIDQLTGDLEAAQSQSQLNQSTATNVAADIGPLAMELAMIAKVKAEMGNVAGAEVELDQARKYVALIEKLGGASGDVQTIIGETEAIIAGDAPEEAPAAETTDEAPAADETADEAAVDADADATADEAAADGSAVDAEALDAPVDEAADDAAAADVGAVDLVEPIVDSQALTAEG